LSQTSFFTSDLFVFSMSDNTNVQDKLSMPIVLAYTCQGEDGDDWWS
jgi:hypothetical protein